MSMNRYKTLKQIDGQEYITVAEHEEIVKSIGDFMKALRDAQTAVQDLGKWTSDLTSSVSR